MGHSGHRLVELIVAVIALRQDRKQTRRGDVGLEARRVGVLLAAGPQPKIPSTLRRRRRKPNQSRKYHWACYARFLHSG
jgi:hypothetical protein